MKAYKCDRCSKLYEEKGDKYWSGYRIIKKDGCEIITLDLCQECKEKLKIFMLDGSNAKKENIQYASCMVCGARFTRFNKDGEARTQCPSCGGVALGLTFGEPTVEADN